MNLKDIIAKTPSEPAFGENARWPTTSMLEALQATLLGRHNSVDDELLELLHARYGDEMQLHIVYNVDHDSDEACSCAVLCRNGDPVLMQHCIGDRSDYHDGLVILDALDAKELVRWMAEYELEKSLAGVTQEDPRDAKLLWPGAYLHPVGVPTLFSVESPRWCCHFQGLIEKYPAYIQGAAKQWHRVLKFVRWVHKMQSWKGPEARLAIVLTEHGEREIDTADIVFKLIEGPDSWLDQAYEDIHAGSWWMCERVNRLSGGEAAFNLLQKISGKMYCRRYLVKLSNAEETNAFESLCKTPVPGKFLEQTDELRKKMPSIELLVGHLEEDC